MAVHFVLIRQMAASMAFRCWVGGNGGPIFFAICIDQSPAAHQIKCARAGEMAVCFPFDSIPEIFAIELRCCAKFAPEF